MPHALAQLTKLRIALLGALSAGMGAALAGATDVSVAVGAALGVLLLATGSCALNEYQERSLDARMPRTAGRPLPAGALAPAAALRIAIALLTMGFATLALCTSPVCVLLGALAAILYNGVYTPLKRVTAFAAVPGAAIGALPPAIGWAAAGGSPADPAIWAVGLFFFLWQVPHFWLLLLRHGEEYERAGLPTLTRRFTKTQLARATFVWIAATAVSCLFIPVFAGVRSYLLMWLLVGAGMWVTMAATELLRKEPEATRARFGFRQMNAYALAVVSALLIASTNA